MQTNETELRLESCHPEITLWFEIRRLWNAWDPIGVACEAIQDEYDAYIAPTLKLLEDGCSREEIEAYLTLIVRDYMGLGEEGVRQSNPGAFAQKVMAWYQDKRPWPSW
ncbi:MAG: hypothetical protein ACU83V_06990 [Gammaproteobacteria bacterium]